MDKEKTFMLGLFSAIAILAGCSRETPPEKSLEATVEREQVIEAVVEGWGDAPDFTLPKLGGGQFTLSSLKGKVIILDFWATWCPPCRIEIPDFISLYQDYKEDGLEIVGIALDQKKEVAVKPFAEKMGINYILVFGGREVTGKYGGIRGIPTTFIIDRHGNIAGKHIGLTSKDVFEKEVKELLGK